jgi:hypothetical protein
MWTCCDVVDLGADISRAGLYAVTYCTLHVYAEREVNLVLTYLCKILYVVF